MKNNFLTSLVLLILPFFGNSQDGISIKVIATSNNCVATNDNTDYSSGNGTFNVYPNSFEIINVYMSIKNLTGYNKSWRITRLEELNIPADWSDHLAFQSSCFAPSILNPFCTPSFVPLVIANGDSTMVEFDINASTNSLGLYKLYFGDCVNYEDSISIQVNQLANIQELENELKFEMFPNPSNEYASIQLNNTEKLKIKVIDLFGTIIYTESIMSSSKINTSDFDNGIYIVTIETEDLKNAAGKLVVRH